MKTLMLGLMVLGGGCVGLDPGAQDDPAVAAVNQAVIAPCPTGQWCMEAAPVPNTVLLQGVFALSANDVFAVGEAGTILRRINNDWTVMASGVTSDMHGVWAASATDVWAVGTDTILRYNGTAWTEVTPSGTADVDAVWGSGPNDVWMVGGTDIRHWNGTSFSSAGAGGFLSSVSGTGPHDVWVSGEGSGLRHFVNSWTTVNSGAGTSNIRTVLSVASNDVWITALVSGKETRHFNGSTWTAKSTSGSFWDSMSKLSASDIWAVDGSRAGHWNGTAWSSTTLFNSTVSLHGVAVVPGHLWAVGSDGVIVHHPL
jgi:frataxin-like iron-binding protein CyaY